MHKYFSSHCQRLLALAKTKINRWQSHNAKSHIQRDMSKLGSIIKNLHIDFLFYGKGFSIRFFQFGEIKPLFKCKCLCETGFFGQILGVEHWLV